MTLAAEQCQRYSRHGILPPGESGRAGAAPAIALARRGGLAGDRINLEGGIDAWAVPVEPPMRRS